ncbi:MAG TPA: DUF2474 domain-containing protein [Castellaniella sp.]|nr:DUF2474 domain-containing protein [Castellaniella sp.]
MSPAGRPGRPRPWWQKLAWMVAIWAASIAALGVVAWLFRVVMKAIGMSL